MTRHRRNGFLQPAFLRFVAALAMLASSSPPELVPPRAEAATASNCGGISTGRIPLNDLGAGLYLGFPGGLYPGGSNLRPAAHAAAGVAIAQAISPLDTLGVTSASGRVVLISIGMSNTTQEFQTFVPKANADPAKNGRVLIVDCAMGGQAANLIRDPNAAYWDSVATRLRRAGSSPAQVQVAWLKEANANPAGGFPASAETLRSNLATIVQILKLKLPNLRLTYLTSRIYAGYASSTLNPEPYAYESGFAVKWLIESQIDGADSLNFDPARGTVRAPWLSWGPYLWADGLNPRSDGLIWQCSDFQSDGTHPATGARNTVADSLLAFFKRDETTVPWFVASTTGVSSPDGADPASAAGAILRVYPVPSSARVTVLVRAPAGERASVRLYDAGGRWVRTGRLVPQTSGTLAAALDVAGLPSGIYYASIRGDAGVSRGASRRIVIVR